MKPHMLFAVLFAGALFAEGGSNMPMLKWAGKDKVVNHHNEVPFRVLERKWIFNAELLSLRGVSESRSPEENSKKSQSLQNSKTPSSESKSILGFGYYELGEPLMNGDVLNENLPAEKIREYVWHTETRGTGNVQQVADVGSDPYLLGVVDETAYYFCYEKAKKVTLNRALLRRLKTKAERYVIYADICLIEAAELKKMNIVFKKIPRDITRL